MWTDVSVQIKHTDDLYICQNMPESAMCLIHDLIKPPNHTKLYEFKNCDGPLKTFYNL